MFTSTPKKAVSSDASLIQCLICAESLENNQRIAVFGRSQWDLSETISKILGGELQPSCKGLPYVCKKKCFPRLIKVEKMSSLKTLQQDELREEISFEAACNVKSLMISINKTSFPSNAKVTPTRFLLVEGHLDLSTLRATLGEDLQTLGKALARKRTYKQIADAAFCCPSLKHCLIKKNFGSIMQGVQWFVL